ncbi:MAG TPA: FtsX-like permease family protein [Dissulfurispiraceae bacterium]
MKFLKLVGLFVLKNIREEKFLTLLSVVGVALGIGLFIGVKVASDRAIASFEADIKGIGRDTNYEILDISGIDFNERAYPEVLQFEEKSYPLLKVNAYIPSLKETVNIHGIYTVKSFSLLNPGRRKNYRIEDFFRELNAVLITRDLAERYSLKEGDTLNTLVYDKGYPLKIAGVLDAESLPADAVIMDLGNFQEYFGKSGSLSKIELKTDERTAAELRALLPRNLSLEKKEELVRSRQSIVDSFRYNLQFVSLIAILVGMFLLYNTVFISVVKRRTEIGILRGLGAGKRTVVMLFIIQGVLLGLVGSAIGIALGQIAAYFSVFAVERTISTMYGAVSVSDYLISTADALKALGLGLLISLIASAVPSFEASRIRPNESAKEGTFESRYKSRRSIFAAMGLFFVIAGGVLSWYDYRAMPFSFPFLAYAGILMIIAGFTFVSPFYLTVALRALTEFAGRALGATGKIAFGDMKGSISRFSVALMSVAISSALIFALFTLIFSFRYSLQTWIRKNISADVYIKPASCTSNFCFYPLPGEAVSLIESLPEVAGVDRFRTLSLDFHGRKIVAGFGDIAVQRRFSRSAHERELAERYKDLEQKQEVSVSNYLSVKYGLKKGSVIELDTPKGKKAFTVFDTFSSYSTTSGFIYMDRKWLKEFWGLDDATQLAVYLKKGADTGAFVLALKDKLLGSYALEVMDNNALRGKVLSIFNRTFAITYAIELISIVVSLIGVLNTLLALILERKREISIIRYLGGSWEQIRQILILSAGVIGIAGIFLGALMGSIMSVIFIQVINKISFGWEIYYRVPVLYLSLLAAVLFFTTLAAGFFPARVARKIDPKRFISFE